MIRFKKSLGTKRTPAHVCMNAKKTTQMHLETSMYPKCISKKTTQMHLEENNPNAKKTTQMHLETIGANKTTSMYPTWIRVNIVVHQRRKDRSVGKHEAPFLWSVND